MGWRKLGLIFNPTKGPKWMKNYASLPIPELLKNNIYRIYFSSRDLKNQSHVGYVDININKPSQVLNLSKNPILSPGRLGSFDENGTMLSWITPDIKKTHFYYIGWNLAETVPFRNSVGLAIRRFPDFQKLKKMPGPILDRSIYDPCFTASVCVLKEHAIWKMWYLSCIKWQKLSVGFKHYYHIKYAESLDGIFWSQKGIVCIDFKNKNEYAISRPSVLKENGIYKMWFSYRGNFYQIGYAESRDGKKWTRMDQKAGLRVSKLGWDSEMVEYPFVFNHQRKRYMLYNGNDFGKSGFGLAIWESSK